MLINIIKLPNSSAGVTVTINNKAIIIPVITLQPHKQTPLFHYTFHLTSDGGLY